MGASRSSLASVTAKEADAASSSRALRSSASASICIVAASAKAYALSDLPIFAMRTARSSRLSRAELAATRLRYAASEDSEELYGCQSVSY